MHIKHFKLGQTIDHRPTCGSKTQITYRHSPRSYDNGQGDRYHDDDILSGISTFLSIVLLTEFM